MALEGVNRKVKHLDPFAYKIFPSLLVLSKMEEDSKGSNGNVGIKMLSSLMPSCNDEE